ncbi:hypothetical protein TgHK011_005889 [Trichoderma gracile]|nr:hypothetical protein TgHK011_005889 [Trichoderma gracile]
MHCTCSPAVYSALSKLGERPVLEGVGREASDSAEQSAAHASQEQKGLDRPASARLESLIRLPVMYEEEAQAVCEGAFASPSESLATPILDVSSCFISSAAVALNLSSWVPRLSPTTTTRQRAEARRHPSLPPLASHLLHLHPGNLLTALRILGLVQIQTSAIDPGASGQASKELVTPTCLQAILLQVQYRRR